jgi:hypothetical protein
LVKVEQAVDRLGADRVVVRVHDPAELDAPLGRDDREGGVDRDRDEGDQREHPVVLDQQDADHQGELEQGRHDVEQHGAEHEADRLDATVDRARELAGAPLQVVAQRQLEQVLEDRQRDLAAGALSDLGEDRIAQLGEQGGAEPGAAIGDQRGQRQHEQAALGHAQAIDDRLVEERDRDVDQLGQQQEDERQDHAHAQLRRILWPQMRQQFGDRALDSGRAGGVGHRSAAVVVTRAMGPSRSIAATQSCGDRARSRQDLQHEPDAALPGGRRPRVTPRRSEAPAIRPRT